MAKGVGLIAVRISSDFLARKKEFKNDWSDAKRNLFMERLCTVASQRPAMGVGVAISQPPAGSILFRDLNVAGLT